MPTLVQINVSRNWGSTGRIAEGIALVAQEQGWKCYIVHGQRYKSISQFQSFQVSNRIEELWHYTQSLLFDKQGQGSTCATKRLVKHLSSIKPDIIHLHVIHGSYLNYPILFDYIKKNEIPVVWTFHDCWAFTGHCTYFDRIGCNKWRSKCFDCPQIHEYPKSIIDCSNRNYNLKKATYSKDVNLTIVPVSEWLGGLVAKSFLGKFPIQVIHNGIDLRKFKASSANIRAKYVIDSSKHIVLGVANGYGKRKGLSDFVRLSETLPKDFLIVMVGVLPDDKKNIPDTIVTICRTGNQQELVDLYSSADVFVNPTYEDNFPTTNLEALACGTPVITYNTGGSPEAIDQYTGKVVARGNIEALRQAVVEVVSAGKDSFSYACRLRASKCFNRTDRFYEYIELYMKILNKKNK